MAEQTANNKNSNKLQKWVVIGLTLAAIVFTAGCWLTSHSVALADHERRMGEVEMRSAKVLDSLARIETKVEAIEKKLGP